MSAAAPTPPLVVLVGDPVDRGPAEAELRAGLRHLADVHAVADVADVAGLPGVGHLAVLVVLTGHADADQGISEVAERTRDRARVIVVSEDAARADLRDAVDRGRLHATLGVPWPRGMLAAEARAQLARWRGTPSTPSIPSARSTATARAGAPPDEASRPAEGAGPPTIDAHEAPASELLHDLELDDATVTRRLLAGLDQSLGRLPRLRLPAGVRLIRQDAPVDGVFVVLVGSVALDRDTPVGDLRLHHMSTGPVVGLLSLAHQRRAFFTALTTSDVEVLHLSIEQLDRALASDPGVTAALAAVSVRALAQRLRRSEQLQVAKIALNQELDEERRRLAEALAQLETARLELVESARFATLGELAAGVAHELNNPVAALTRAASFVATDLDRLLADHPQAAIVAPAFARGRDRPPRSTADERAVRRAVADAVGDPELATRLVAAGIDDPAEARDLATRLRAGDLDLVESAAGLGSALRNLDVAASRIAELTTSLRAYARPLGDPVEGVDLHTTIEDTLRLVAHRLRGIEVERDYGELPPIRCHPGQLDQVWTNLLVNAAESLDGSGTIRIVTDAPDAAHVRVQVVDDGPGIAPETMARLFEPHFTTKRGTVRYGLGLGLAMSKRVVDGHDGDIEVASEPGRTIVTVTLPVAGPADGAEEVER